MENPQLLLYYSYFKHQAVSIPELGHQDSDGNRVFLVTGADDIYDATKFKTKEKGYQLRVINPTSTTSDTIHHAKIQYGFVILHFHSKRENGDNGYIQAMSKSYQMGWRLVNQMLFDAKNGRLFMSGIGNIKDLNVACGSRESDIDPNYSGYVFTFEGFEKINQCVPDSSRFGVDGGLTPKNILDLYANSFTVSE